ncbi:DsrE family protein [Flagellimonas myxillae]|uniref:DsrE family protein n=1 Tax=Flagellimonas myxillae TaxID=2942214 RepID=UPI00201F7948|nr:DsrE family protein [Muricauda myxillae]MCL6265809.1 DsrE family protein [Muricauda myxillae]
MKYNPLAVLIFCFTCIYMNSQEKKAGPVIEEFGPVWAVENPGFETDTKAEFKVVFEIADTPESHTTLNKTIETAARFYNMHAQSGVPVSQLHVALVVHHKASKDIIDQQAYLKRYGVKNPNFDLVKSLLDSGAQVILCGQSSYSRNIPKEDLIPDAQIALSAMTALLQLQNQGYHLIKF